MPLNLNNHQSQDIDNDPMRFGKYKGETPMQIVEHDPQYIVWLYENITPKVCTKDLYQCAEMDSEDGADEGDRWSTY